LFTYANYGNTQQTKKQVSAYNILITMSHVHLTVQCYHNDYIISEMDFGSHCKYKKKNVIYI